MSTRRPPRLTGTGRHRAVADARSRLWRRVLVALLVGAVLAGGWHTWAAWFELRNGVDIIRHGG